jgi:hypothetical protein
MAEPADLALEDLAETHQDRIGVLERPEHAGGVGDRRERVAQLVREHAEELALTPLGEAQLLGPLGERLLELLPLVDVDAAADVADRLRRRCRSSARRCRASSGIRRRGGADASPSRTGARASKLVARMPRQRSRSSGWTERVQPSPSSSAPLRPVKLVHDGLNQSLARSSPALQIRTGAASSSWTESLPTAVAAALVPSELASEGGRCVSPATASLGSPSSLPCTTAGPEAAIGMPP